MGESELGDAVGSFELSRANRRGTRLDPSLPTLFFSFISQPSMMVWNNNDDDYCSHVLLPTIRHARKEQDWQ